MGKLHFLSDEAYGEVRSLMEKRGRDAQNFIRAVTLGDAPLYSLEDLSYDNAYLALLDLALTGRPHIRNIPDTSAQRANYTASFLLDIDIPTFHGGKFEDDPPIDEFAVNAVVNFISAVRYLIPYKLDLRYISLGCVFLQFGMHLAPPQDLPGHPKFQFGEIDTSLDFNKRYFTGHAWELLVGRYKVACAEIMPIRK